MPRNSTPIGCRPRNVFRNRPPSRTVRSPPSTRAQDSSRASSTCPYHAGSAWPGVSSAAVPVGANCRSTFRQCSTNGSMREMSCETNSSGTTRPSRLRFCSACATPSTRPVRSASTIHDPSRRAHEVGGIELQQPATIGGRNVTTWPQERWIGIDQRRRHDTIGQQSLLPVQVGQHRIQQPCALREPGFEHVEFSLRQRQRNRIESPRIGRRSRQQTCRALFLHHALEPAGALGQHTVAEAGKHAEQAAPLRAQPTFAVHHLVACHGRRLTSQPDRRKSPITCHCEERSDAAILVVVPNLTEIASLRLQ